MISPLPTEIWTQILTYVKHYRTLESCAPVNKQFNAILSGPEFDQVLYRLPDTTEIIQAITTGTMALERNVKLNPCLLCLHNYCSCSPAFDLQKLLVHISRDNVIPFKDSLVAQRSLSRSKTRTN